MNNRPIAIIGASCRFPGAANLDGFWDLLVSGRDAISTVGDERWSTRYYYHPNRASPAKSYTWAAGLLTGVDQFEPAFFGISPREAAQMDPQQRLLLELVWHATEDAGIPASKLAGAGTGVYIGASSTDYRDLRLGDPASGDSYFMTGGTLSIIANRISYVFDLHGPSLAIDTACSSSMVALHHACEAIRDGRIESAIVGGINLLLAPYPFIGFSRASMLSHRGRCFAFDERADGYVRGEGGGVAILKPLDQAVADGDRIRAVINGTGVNSDGRTIGLSMPSDTAQAMLIRKVCAEAGIVADDLAFFEMHGTGTPAGDPIEAGAVGRALGQQRLDVLRIGSVKTNIGHLEPASGMAGLLKAALALDHGIVPPSLNCDTPNPKIPFGELNIRVIRKPEPVGEHRYAGVNSFGFGGTNAHAVLAAPPTRPTAQAAAGETLPPPLVLSARSQESLRELARNWRDKLASTPADAAPALLRGLARHREQHPERLVALGESRVDIVTALSDFAEGVETGDVVTGSALRDGKVGFVFAGNGAQWPGMGQHAYRANRRFREAVHQASDALLPALGWSVGELIDKGVTAEELVHADVAQPLLFAIQVGIVTVLRRMGIDAAGHIGHSVGEIAAAWGAGALSLDEAARVVVARSRQQERTRGDGRMAALSLGAEAARELLAEIGSPLEIGAINATQSVTVSGASDAIDRLGAEAQRRGVGFRALALEFAFHSAAMDPIHDDLVSLLDGLNSAEPRQKLVSTVTGQSVAAGLLDADYWWRNIRSPVRFTDGMAALTAQGCRFFIEIGPHPVLQAYLHDALRAAEGHGRVLGTLHRRQGSEDPFPAIAARCHVAGHDIVGADRFDGPAEIRGLPLYPWNRERFWVEWSVEGSTLTDPPFDHPLLGFRQTGPLPFWINHLDSEILPWLADHAIEGVPVFPAAAVVEMALAAARHQRPEARSLEIADLELRRPLPFDKGRARELRAAIASEDGDWELSSRPRLADEPMTLHAVARLVSVGDQPAATRPVDKPVKGEVAPEHLYRLASQLGLDYGPQFRSVRRIALLSETEAVADLDSSVIGEPLDEYLIHPSLLDGALQALLALIAERGGDLDGSSFLPWRFGRVRLEAPFGRTVRQARVRVTRLGKRSAAADIVILDDAGDPIAELTDCWFRRVELTRRGSADENILRLDLVPRPLVAEPAPAVLDDIGDIVASLTGRLTPARPAEHALLLDALIASIAYRVVREIADPGVSFALDELVENGAVAPDALPLFGFLLRAVARLGGASQINGNWTITDDADLPDIAEVWRLLLAESPDLVAELALIAESVEELPGLLARGLRQPESSPPAMIEHLLHGSPISAGGIDLLAGTLSEIAGRWPKGRTLRVLEIGADGGATRHFLDALAQTGAPFEYRATHPDPEQAARLDFVVAGVPGAGAGNWPGGEPQNDELGVSSFDIVLAAQASGRLRFDNSVLTRVREILAPGGAFIALEPAPNQLWDLVFGRYTGWWRGDDNAADASPLRAPEEWRAELAISGFVDFGTTVVASSPWASAGIWGRTDAQVPAVSASARPSVKLVTNTGLVSPLFAEGLGQAGYSVTEIAAEAISSAALGGNEDASGVAVLAVQEGKHAANEAAAMLSLFARVASLAAQRQMPLYLVTVGAQQIGDAGPAGIVGAALWGFGRVLMNEMPRLALRLIDLPASAEPAEQATIFARELAAASPESEIVWTAAGRHVARLRRGLLPRWATASDKIGLSSGQQSGLDALRWQPIETRAPAAGEIVIDVKAAGLNFRDMMWAMGLLPEEALIDGFAGASFGLECAGVVSAVGADVDDLVVGDRVAGFAPASLSSQVTTAAHAVMRLPDETDFVAAATIPVTFVTVVYALGTLGQVAPGETVLIHAAAGGVGLAAIQYAKYRGAAVIATAGSEIKRSFLRLAGADHVLDSRDLGFADAVRAISPGGVDLVLNSLSGEAMEQSLGLLKPFGRFLELGKRDFYLNRRIHLRPLRQNVTYFAIDVDQLPVQRPDLARALLSEVSEALASGAIRPLAHRAFTFAGIGEAFRLMQASGHIGKLVLVPDDSAGVQLAPKAELSIGPDGTYLVTGGISGFGFATARWLVEQGARSIALLGRRGAETPGAAERLEELAALGAMARVYAADVADENSLAAALQEIRRTQSALRGVVHAASIIGDALATELNDSNIAEIIQPKLAGAVLLDKLTDSDPIDLFLMFSSATTVLGAPGQGVYVAANVAVEAIARQRHARGKPALTVAWGPIEDTGYLADRPETREALARRLGAKPMPSAKGLAALPVIAASGLPVVAFAETSWNEARRFLPILASPLFADIRSDAGSVQSDDNLVERLASLDGDEALGLLKTVVAEEAANILRLPASGIDSTRPLSEMGMDSLMAVELRLALEGRLRVDLPLMSLAEGTSVASIATRLVSSVSGRPAAVEVLNLAERYEGVVGGGQPGDGEGGDGFPPIDLKSAAAE